MTHWEKYNAPTIRQERNERRLQIISNVGAVLFALSIIGYGAIAIHKTIHEVRSMERIFAGDMQ